MKQDILLHICSREALDRLNRVKLLKPKIAESVENKLLGAARAGQITRGKVDESLMKNLLETAVNSRVAITKVTVQRKKYFEESDEDDSDLL